MTTLTSIISNFTGTLPGLSVFYLSTFYTDNLARLTTGQPSLVASGNPLYVSSLIGKTYIFYSVALLTNINSISTQTTITNIISLNILGSDIKKSGFYYKIGVVSAYIGKIANNVVFRIYKNNTLVFTAPNQFSSAYSIWSIDVGSTTTINYSNSDNLSFQYSLQAGGNKTFYAKCFSNGILDLNFTLV